MYQSLRAAIGEGKKDGTRKDVIRPYTPENLGDQTGFLNLVFDFRPDFLVIDGVGTKDNFSQSWISVIMFGMHRQVPNVFLFDCMLKEEDPQQGCCTQRRAILTF